VLGDIALLLAGYASTCALVSVQYDDVSPCPKIGILVYALVPRFPISLRAMFGVSADMEYDAKNFGIACMCK